MIHVGIEQKDRCYIGILDEVNIPPSSPKGILAYVDLLGPEPNYVVAGREELIIRNVKP